MGDKKLFRGKKKQWEIQKRGRDTKDVVRRANTGLISRKHTKIHLNEFKIKQQIETEKKGINKNQDRN